MEKNKKAFVHSSAVKVMETWKEKGSLKSIKF